MTAFKNKATYSTTLIVSGYFVYTFMLFFVGVSGCRKNTSLPEESIVAGNQLLNMNFEKIDEVVQGYYSIVPGNYSVSDEKYPLIVFLHGTGQIGNGNSDLYRVLFGGIPKVASDSLLPSGFKANGRTFSFIILAPQFSRWPKPENILSFIQYAKLKYRVDGTRVYLSGLSGGGILTTDVASKYPAEFAAIIPIAGVLSGPGVMNRCAAIAESNLPVWVFQNTDDEMFSFEKSKFFVSQIRSLHPATIPKFTQFQPYGINGHDAWTKASDPNYREDGMNIYEWMLQYTSER